MTVFAIGAVALIAMGALLLFALLVVLGWTLDLVRETKGLAARVGVARERLRQQANETRTEAERASERLQGLRRRRSRRV